MDGNWKDCFSARILDRGYEYYLNDCIQDIERTKDGFMAVVDGSREYTVTIDIDDDGNFLDADCDCPYSQDGNYCKHEAAVLYSLELDEDDWTGEDCDVEDDESLEEIVRQMSRDELESVVLDIASYDRKIRNRILLAYSDSSSSAFLGTLKEEVRKLCTTIREAEDEWYDEFNEKVESAADELSDVLESSIRTMLDKGRSSDAF